MISKSGLRVRRAARSVVLSAPGRVLLFRFELIDRPPFWVTPGGECEPDESFADGARRELFEETGLAPQDMGSEIARTTPQFVTVEGEPVQADERYFLVRTQSETISTAHHTELEKRVMTSHRWFDLGELDDWPEAIYPEILAEIIARVSDR
ncbi:MAG: NUDIX domain-containing protein [Pseudomonadota bacterium]